MKEQKSIDTLLIDIGGVLLTNGWDGKSRKKAIEQFELEAEEVDALHHLNFDTFELGKMSLDDYVRRVFFHRPRSFTLQQFKNFMFQQSQPHSDMIHMIDELKTIAELKKAEGIKVVAVSNEGRELMDYRLEKFDLRSIIDTFVVSSYVHLRKPDKEIFRLAIDLAGSHVDKAVYIDDRIAFVEVANELGIAALQHTSLEKTKEWLISMICHGADLPV